MIGRINHKLSFRQEYPFSHWLVGMRVLHVHTSIPYYLYNIHGNWLAHEGHETFTWTKSDYLLHVFNVPSLLLPPLHKSSDHMVTCTHHKGNSDIILYPYAVFSCCADLPLIEEVWLQVLQAYFHLKPPHASSKWPVAHTFYLAISSVLWTALRSCSWGHLCCP